ARDGGPLDAEDLHDVSTAVASFPSPGVRAASLAASGGGDTVGSEQGDADRPLPEERGGHVSIAEPLYGFLPGADQLRLARETGYQALLYTKVSILLSAAIGVLLAGAWEIVPETEALPSDAVLRLAAWLYLIAESVRRYISFSRGEP